MDVSDCLILGLQYGSVASGRGYQVYMAPVLILGLASDGFNYEGFRVRGRYSTRGPGDRLWNGSANGY